MTARPDAQELTEAEQRFLDRPDAPESLRERVARAIEQAWESLPDLALASECSPILANVVLDVITTPQAVVDRAPCPICGSPNALHNGDAHNAADAALAVVRGET